MSKTKSIDFKHGIRTVLKTQNHDRKLEPKSLDLLNTILNDVRGRLVDRFNEEYSSCSKGEKSGLFCAQKAVEKVFTGSLKKHAIYESSRQLVLFDIGHLKYDADHEIERFRAIEKEQRSLKQSSRTPTSPDAPFRTGVAKLCPTEHLLKADAKEYLAEQLQSFARKVVGEATPREDVQLEPQDVREVMAKMLGPKVFHIACSEGHRSLLLYTNGFIGFFPKRPKKKEPEVVKEEVVREEGSGWYRNGLKKFLSEYSSDASLETKAVKAIELILYTLAEYMAAYAAEVCQEEDKLELSDAEIRECVDSDFPGMIKRHAKIQGYQDVEAYNQGLIKYRVGHPRQSAKRKASDESVHHIKKRKTANPPTRKPAHKKPSGMVKKEATRPKKVSEVKEKVKKEKLLDFTSAILDCYSSVFPDMKVSTDKKATAKIEKILNDVCQCVASSVSPNRESGELGLLEINNAIESLIPGDLQHHAVTSAASRVMVQDLPEDEE